MLYPYNWAKVNEAYIPIGYEEKHHLTGFNFFSPVEGPYSIAKEYAMQINYDSTYGENTPYIVRLHQDMQNRAWIKTIEEYSLNGQQNRILASESNPKFFEEGKGYALLNLNLTSLKKGPP
jgi:hypothetical protein